REQYSSVAFWAIVVGEQRTADPFLIQALLDLLLMAQGVYLLSRLCLKASVVVASTLAIVAVANNFYLSTFFASHEGSLIYGAVTPFMLLFFLQWDSGQIGGRSWLLMMLWGYFILFAYVLPTPFLLLPALAYVAFRRAHRLWQWDRRLLSAVR